MERTRREQHLAEAEARVALGERHLAQQRELIAKLEVLNFDLTDARNLLRLFEEIQILHVAHRDRLRRQLGGG